MSFTIKLEFLDKHPSSYSNPVNIVYNNRIDKVIGHCEIYMINEKHYGNVEMDEDVDTNLFLYYASKPVPNPDNYPLAYLSLHDEPRKDVFTKRLKEIIVK